MFDSRCRVLRGVIMFKRLHPYGKNELASIVLPQILTLSLFSVGDSAPMDLRDYRCYSAGLGRVTRVEPH